jgi:glycosyltransferase involved in cell wall biosynthesis
MVAASALEGLKDAIKENENGFLVECENADAWAGKIKTLLADDEFRRKFGEKAREYTIENYSWDKIAKRYLEEMEKVAKK